MPTGRPTSTSPRSPRAQHVRRGLADLDPPGAAAAGEVRVRRRGPARLRGRFAGLRRLHHQRLDGAPLGAVLQRARAQLRQHRGLGDPARGHGPAAREAEARAWSTSAACCPRALWPASTRRKIASASTSPRTGITLITPEMLGQEVFRQR